MSILSTVQRFHLARHDMTVESISDADCSKVLAQPHPVSAAGLATEQSPIHFERISEPRKQWLETQADILVHRHGRMRGEPNGSNHGRQVSRQARFLELNYLDFKNILLELKNSKLYSDNEKAYIWSKIAEGKGNNPWYDLKYWATGNLVGGSYKVSLSGVNPSVVDSQLWGMRAADTPTHTIAAFEDRVHGYGNPPDKPGADGSIGLAYFTPAAAEAHIVQHEAKQGIVGFNHGDANASRALVAAFRAYREAPDGQRFEAFATTWIKGIVMP
jgi:hypothetical protein